MASHNQEVVREQLLAEACPNGHLAGASGCDFCGCDDCNFGCSRCKKKVNLNLASFLDENGMAEYDILTHFRILTDTIRVFVEKMDGEKIILDVERRAWVEEVKGQLEVIIWAPPCHQRLIFKDEVLDDEKRLDDYDIQHDATMTLVVVNMEQDPDLSEEPAHG